MKFKWVRFIRTPDRILLGALALLISQASLCASDLALGNKFGALVDADTSLFAWGANQSGQLGVDSTVDQNSPVLPDEAGPWSRIAVALTVSNEVSYEGHTLAVKADGTLWAWGSNERGQLGLGDTTDSLVPVRVGNASDWVDVEAGGAFSLARNSLGELYVWGDNSFGQLGGASSSSFVSTPTKLDSHVYIAMAAGYDYALAIRSFTGATTDTYGYIWGWGRNSQGQLGLGNKNAVTVPTQMPGTRLWRFVEAGLTSSFGIDTSTYLYAWGNGPFGSLGLGPVGPTAIFESVTPQQIDASPYSSAGWESVSAGTSHTLGKTTSGLVFGAGQNASGQLGISGGGTYPTFQRITLPVGVVVDQVGAGRLFSAVLLTDGRLLTAGLNDRGQLANGVIGGASSTFTNSLLGLADLEVTAVTVSNTEPTPGLTVSGSIFLANNGSGAVEDSFGLEAVLSPTADFDDVEAIALDFTGIGGTLTVTDDIAPGSATSLPFELDLPASINAGTYYIIVRADSAGVLTEATADNNTKESSNTIDFTADLVIESITVNPDDPTTGGVEAFPLSRGSALQIEVVIKNEGKGALPAGPNGAFDFRLFLSTTQNVNAVGAVDLVADSEVLAGISGNGDTITLAYTLTEALTLPLTLSIGDYFVGAVVDVNEDISESNEDNNTLFTPSAVVVITGIELEEALDTVLFTTPIDFSFATSSDPLGLQDWFGQDAVTDDGVDAARSPSLVPGQSASFKQSGFTTDAVKVTFRWKALTSSPENYLYFGLSENEVDGSDSRISGNQDWTEVTHIVPPNSRMTWTYVQTEDAGVDVDDAVYVDSISVTELTEPDLVIKSVTGQAGTYVLGSDNLALRIISYNQGADTNDPSGTEEDPIPIPFDIGVYLSLDRNFNGSTDILVDTLPITEVFKGGDTSLYIPDLVLPETIPADDYYLIVVIDDGSTVTEEAGGGEANNIFVSTEADVTIQALPDMRVVSLSPNPGYYIVGDELDFSFGITNDGLGDVTEPFNIRIVLSVDNIAGESDYEIASFPFNGALPVGATQVINPDIYQIPSDVPLGRRLYFGVIVDSESEIAEENEGNNAAVFPDNDFVFSKFTIEEAFELVGDATVDDFYPFTENLPWYGQSEITMDGIDAISNIDINNGETASFEITVNAPTDTFITFRWKVSSEHDVLLGQRDTLNFYVDDLVNPVRSIFGEVDWSRVSVFVPAGAHTLRWAYIKDASGSSGADAGWLDLFNFEVPDLVVDPVDFPSGTFLPGATIPDFSLTVRNNGIANVPATPFYNISIIASADTVFGNDGDNVLASISETQGLLAGDSRDYLTDLVLPASLPEGMYYIGVKVDTDEIIPEASENNNEGFTASAVLAVAPPISLNAAIDDPDADTATELPLELGGQQGWFALADSPLSDGTRSTTDGTDAAQSGPIDSGEASYFQTLVEGPKELKFRWKVNSSPTSNFLKFSLNDILIEQISGDVDWEFGFGGFTLTYNSETTTAIASGASGVEVAAALNALDSIIDVGGVSVSGGPLVYDIVFSDVGNKDPISVAAINPLKVISASVVTQQNGEAAVNETQRVTIAPNVTFRLNYDGDYTEDLPYTATAAEVKAALDLVTGADGPVTVTGSDLDFEVTFDNPGSRAEIAIDRTGLRQPGTVENAITTAGDVGTQQVQQVRIGPEITVFIPAGTQELRWTYVKNTTGVDTIDAGWVDQIQLDDITVPELVLTSLNYSAGEYILDVAGIGGEPDQLLGTEYLDITVEAENQGVTFTGPAFTTADIEVRLSLDRIYGNGDDIVLGTVSQVEGTLAAGDLMRFIGPIQLGDSIPEDTYYLMARVDSNEQVAEYAETNNIWIAENRDVQITRLPALRIYNEFPDSITEFVDGDRYFLDPTSNAVQFSFDIDEDVSYYTESPMRLRFAVQNVGLDRVDGNLTWTTRVNLNGAPRIELSTSLDLEEYTQKFISTITLGEFTIQELMEGRSQAKPDGDIIELDLDLALPSGARLNEIIDTAIYNIEDYLWHIEIVLDATGVVEQSEIVRESPSLIAPANIPWWILSPFEASDLFANPNTNAYDGLFGIQFQPAQMLASSWETQFDDPLTPLVVENPYPTTNPDNLLAYAFGRNPEDGDTVGGQFPGTYGVTGFEGTDVLSIAFDLVTRASDLRYTVEAADDPGFSVNLSTLAVVEGPYDELTGPASLTGDGGLIDGAPLLEDNVTAIIDQGYSARITVKDNVDLASVAARFIRVRLEFDAAASDADSDGVSTIAELFYGTDPTDSGDTPILTAAEMFVVEQLFDLGVAYAGAINFAPTDDYDSDGVDNLTELMAGSNPTVDTDLPTALEEYVATQLASLGVVSSASVRPTDDYDSDGVSTIAELLYLTDPTDSGDTPSIALVDEFVAEQMSLIGVYAPLTAGFRPEDDFDFDKVSNVAELLYGADPTNGLSIPFDFPSLFALEFFVAEELAAAGALGVGILNIGPYEDFDFDGIPNAVELLYNTNPISASDTPVLSPLEVAVALGIAEYLADKDPHELALGLPNLGPADDFDGDNFSNIDELNELTDPTDEWSFPTP